MNSIFIQLPFFKNSVQLSHKGGSYLLSLSSKPFTLIGFIQTLYRKRVKSQSLGSRTLNSESASKIMSACGISVLECNAFNACVSAYFSKKHLR